MFNLINSYKSLFLFLKMDFSGPEKIHFSDKLPDNNPTIKQGIEQKTNIEKSNKNISIELSWDDKTLNYSEMFNKLGLQSLVSNTEIINKIKNHLNSKWIEELDGTVRLNISNWHTTISWTTEDWFIEDPKIWWPINIDITEKVDKQKALDKKEIINDCKSWLKNLKWECVANGLTWKKSTSKIDTKDSNGTKDSKDSNDTWRWNIDISKLSWAVRSHIINPENVKIAMNFFIDKWFTKEQTAWLLANMCQESSFAENPKWNKNHFWMFQWSKLRATQISKWSWVNLLSRKAPILDQLKWLYWEITQNSKHCPWTFEWLKSAKTPEEAALVFLTKFEKPGWMRREKPLRASYARSFYKAMS